MTFNPQLGTQGVYNMTLPNNPVVVPQQADFRTTNSQEFDLSPLIDKGTMDFISGVWADNSGNAQALVITVSGTNQVAIFPAGAQGYLPLLAPDRPKFTASCATVPGVIIPILFHNIPLLPWLTFTGGIPVSGNPAFPVYTQAKPQTLVKSSVALTGGSDIAVVAGGAPNYLLIYNPVGNAPVTVDPSGGDATSGFQLLAGGSYEKAISGITNQVTVKGTAAQSVEIWVG